MARRGVTGPCVAEYGPLAIGNRNSITVPKIASTARPRPRVRNRMGTSMPAKAAASRPLGRIAHYQSSPCASTSLRNKNGLAKVAKPMARSPLEELA